MTRRAGRAAVGALLGSTALSVAGNTMVAVLVPWLVLQRTGSPALAGLVTAAGFAAMVPALLFGGVLIDRWGRRRASVVADLLSAAAVAALPLLDAGPGLTAASITALVALGAAFDGPGMAAREALRPDVADAAGMPLEKLNAGGEAVDGAGAIAGPGLAGLGIGLVGLTGSLWVAAAMFAAAAALTACWVPAAKAGPPEPYGAATLAGLRLVRRDPTLRAVGVAGMLVMLVVAPIVLVLTTHLQRTGSPGDLGLVVAAFSVGGVAGALAYGAVAGRVRRRPVLLASLLATSLGLGSLALLPGPWTLAALAAAVGVVSGPLNPVLAVVTQDRTPEAARGRVIGTLGSLSLLATPVGALAGGFLLEAGGPAAALLAIGGGCLLATASAALAPGLRRIEHADLRPGPGADPSPGPGGDHHPDRHADPRPGHGADRDADPRPGRGSDLEGMPV